MALSQHELTAWRRDGVVPLGPVMTDDQVAETRRRIEAHLTGDRAVEAIAGTGRSGRLFRIQNLSRDDDWFAKVIRLPAVLDAAAAVLDGDVQHFQDQAFCKPAGDGGVTAWHQDNWYWGGDPPDMLTVWIALDDTCAANGRVQYVAGSHGAKIEPMKVHREDASGARVCTIGEEQFDASRLVAWDVPAGHAVMHHCQTIHGSGPNTTDGPRRGVTVHLMREGVFPGDERPVLRRRG